MVDAPFEDPRLGHPRSDDPSRLRGNWKTTPQECLTYLNAWIDSHPANTARDPEAQTWGRLAKVSEEAGEVIAAYIGVTGQNPRKGFSGDISTVEKELLDVALTALCAVEHLNGGTGRAYEMFGRHCIFVYRRAMGVSEDD